MAREKGVIGISAAFEAQSAMPMDARMRVPTKAELLLSATWTANDANIYIYKGMLTVVWNDTTENNGIYRLLDIDYTNISNWERVGTGGGSGDVVSVDFIPQNPALAYKKGRLYYDNLEDALTYFNSVNGLSNQIGREIWVRVRNTTGSTISNGKAVYITGADTGIATIELADCKYYTKSRIIGIATHDIVSDVNGFGYVTFIGRVNDVTTTGISTGSVIFLKEGFPGDFTTDAPTGGCYKVRLGIVVIGNSANGAIEVNTSASEYAVETVKETGFPDRSQLSFNFVNATRTFTIQPSGTEFRYYEDGEKYIKTSTESLVISDVEGSHFIYYNGTTLAELVNGTTEQIKTLIRNHATVYYIDWDTDNQRENIEVQELHYSKDYGIENHIKDHLTQGALYGTGLGVNTINIAGTGDLATHAQFGIDAGSIYDEDIDHSISAMLPTVGCERIYYYNAAGRPRYSTNVGFSVLTAGTGRLAYDPIGSTLTEVSNGNYVWYHIFATPHRVSSRGVSSFVGRSQFTSTANAYTGLNADALAVQSGSLPSPEFKLIASVLFQTSNTYNNTVKARTRPANTAGDSFIDWRKSNVQYGGTVSEGGIVTPVFSDTDFKLFDNSDITKELQFEVSGLPTSTLSTVAITKAGTIAMTTDLIASNIGNTPNGNITSTNQQAVNNELDTLKQNITDNTLNTTDKTIVGAINEVNSKSVTLANPTLEDATDSTKKTTINLSEVTSGQTRIFKLADRDVNMNNNIINSLGVSISGNGGVIAIGNYGGYVRIPYNCVITGWNLYEATTIPVSTTCVLDVWKKSSFYPTVADTIFGTKPSLTAATNNSATGLNISVTAGDIITYNVDSNSAALNLILQLTVLKS